jgi:putative transposase
MESVIPKRKSLRLPNYDYSQPGGYFVTICTARRKNFFGCINNGIFKATDVAAVIQHVWEDLPNRFPIIILDAFVIMRNHLHGIIIVGAQFIAPSSVVANEIENKNKNENEFEGVMNHAPTLGKIIRTFKSTSTRIIRKNAIPQFAWQRNYYEHVIRNEASLNHIRQYICTNHLRWELDRENPSARGKDDFDGWLATFKTSPGSKNQAISSRGVTAQR